MHFVNQGVVHGRRTDIGSPVDDAQVSRVDQRLQHALESGPQIIVDRAHFQEHHAAFLERFRKRIGQGNGRHVACSQDGNRFRVSGTGRAVVRGEAIVEILAADAVSHPGGHFERRKREPVIQDARWQQGNAEPSLRSEVCLARQPRQPRCFDPAQ